MAICQYSRVPDSTDQQAAIRRFYRRRRVDIDKTQEQVAAAAAIDRWRYFRIENGRAFPTKEERGSLARVLGVAASALPSEATS